MLIISVVKRWKTSFIYFYSLNWNYWFAVNENGVWAAKENVCNLLDGDVCHSLMIPVFKWERCYHNIKSLNKYYLPKSFMNLSFIDPQGGRNIMVINSLCKKHSVFLWIDSIVAFLLSLKEDVKNDVIKLFLQSGELESFVSLHFTYCCHVTKYFQSAIVPCI